MAATSKYGKSNMKIIYRIDGSDLFIDKTEEITFYKGMKVIINSKIYEIKQLTLDYHCENPSLEIELIADLKNSEEVKEILPEGKYAKCIYVWERSKSHITLGKSYEIIREVRGKFFIIDDEGNQRSYTIGRNNTQFQLP